MTSLSPLVVFALMLAPGAATAQVASAPVAESPSPSTTACELHVFPAHNFMSLNSGLLSGFGPIGALVDMGAHKNRAMTVKELMAADLPPDVQLAELTKVGMLSVLKMPLATQVVAEAPFPNADDLKANPALKPQLKQREADEAAGKRLSGSTSGCYGELVVAYVMYQRAAMYGTRVFTFFEFRDYRGRPAPLVSRGQVENHLPNFPPTSPDQLEASKAELIDAFGANLTKWAQLKLNRG